MNALQWSHQQLADAAELEAQPPMLPADEAQEWCNFVLFLPTEVPEDCVVNMGTLRREAPPGRIPGHTIARTPTSDNNPSTYRFEITGRNRRLRVKQFLYDWAFPALDHPSLWDGVTRAVPIDDRYVLWHGRDYLNNAAASARIDRTMVEVSVLGGVFDDREILDLYRSLRAVNSDAAEKIANTSFAALSYWARRPDAPTVPVPLGLWKFRQSVELRQEWRHGPQAAEYAAATGLPTALGGFQLDSVAEETSGKEWCAAELIYTSGPPRGHELRLYKFREDLVDATPGRDDHPASDSAHTIGGQHVELAWIDEQVGPFDAIVRDNSGAPRFRLMSTTGIGLDRAWFLSSLRNLPPAGEPQ